MPAVRLLGRLMSTRRPARLGRRLGVALLALLALGACSSRSVRKGEELRSTDFRLLELNRATEEVKRDVVALRDQVESVRTQAEGAVQSAAQTEDGRRREALEAVDKRLATMERRLESLAGAIRGIEMTVGGLADQVMRLEAVPAVAPAGNANGAGASAGSAAAPSRR
ncbi:MAG: hypothetical protein ACREMB_02040, partial [Candidatus Rokuibacteriota bacterium]